jgi:hypothetical protein
MNRTPTFHPLSSIKGKNINYGKAVLTYKFLIIVKLLKGGMKIKIDVVN